VWDDDGLFEHERRSQASCLALPLSFFSSASGTATTLLLDNVRQHAPISRRGVVVFRVLALLQPHGHGRTVHF